MKTRFLLLILSVALATLSALGQSSPTTETRGTPILTGYTGLVTNFEPGSQELGPVFNPIVLVPLGRNWLIEAEGEFEGGFRHDSEESMWDREYEKNLEYLQLDYTANRYLTIVAGRFLTPFGTFNERLHPLWIRNFLNAPMITGAEMGSSNGIQFRGGIPITSNANFEYSAFFSALSTTKALESNRAAGGRIAVFVPRQRLEIGFSAQRILQDEHFTIVGADASYQPMKTPLELRGEFARAPGIGTGYWAEAAYRLRRSHNAFLRKSQPVFRVEQFFLPAEMAGMDEMGEELPEINTQRASVGWNYYVNDGFKLSFAYGRNFAAEDNHNIFTIGIAYRLMVPFSGGK